MVGVYRWGTINQTKKVSKRKIKVKEDRPPDQLIINQKDAKHDKKREKIIAVPSTKEDARKSVRNRIWNLLIHNKEGGPLETSS